MEEMQIFIFDEIGGNGITPSDIQAQINQNKEAKKIKLFIDSGGGEVFAGMAIRNILINSGKEIETEIVGVCGSIATVIAFAAKDLPKINPNARFLVHDPMVGVQGNKEDLEKAASELTNITDELVKIYQNVTGKNEQDIRDLMKEDRFMTAEEAESFGFVSVKEPLKAVATIDLNFNNQKMDKKEVNASELSIVEQLVNGLTSALKPKNEVTEEVKAEVEEEEEEEEFDAKNAVNALNERLDTLASALETMTSAKNKAEKEVEEKESILNNVLLVVKGFENKLSDFGKMSVTSDKGEAPVKKDAPKNSKEEEAFGGFASFMQSKIG